MILPARYGRLWSVAAVLVIFIVLLTTFRARAPSQTPSAPGFALDEQRKPLQEEHETLNPPRPAAPTTPSPRTTTSTTSTRTTPTTHLTTTTSSTHRDTPAVSTEAAGDVESDVLTPTTSPNATLAGAAKLVQPGIQPDSSSVVNPEVKTLAEGAGVIVSETPTTTTSEPTRTGRTTDSTTTTASLTQADSPQEVTPANAGALGQPGIQPGTSTSRSPATRIADGAAVIIEAETSTTTTASTSAAPIGTELSKLIVMGRLSHEDTDWVDQELPDWLNAIYYVDLKENATSPSGLRTKMNKAREAMPYLTYIIDNYPIFPDVVVFMHPHKSGMPQAWHNDARGHNAVVMLQELKLETVIERGYVNLRCKNEVGCPEEIIPFRDPPLPGKHAEQAYPHVYAHFFNATFPQMREEIPVVATQCCAQFAVSSAQLGKRPKEDYEMYRKYLEETEYDDDTIGRVMEYMWHIIFGRGPVHCENVFECWCAVYGRCRPGQFRGLFDWKRWFGFGR